MVNFSQRRVLLTTFAVLIVFAIAVGCVIRFGGPLTPTILGIIGTALTPTIGALITLLVVSPLREAMRKSTETMERVEKKVNGQMDALRKSEEEAAKKWAAAIDVAAEYKAQAADYKSRASKAEAELQMFKERLKQFESGLSND